MCVGFANTNSTAYISEPVGNSGAAIIVNKKGDRSVTLYRLDDFCCDRKIDKIDFLKIDVEGFERYVLEGGKETLKKSRPVMLIELNPVALAKNSQSVLELVEFIKHNGYVLYEVMRTKLKLLTHLPGGEDHIDAFCFPREKIEPFKKEGVI
ncbi:MAG: FkbM family methyltransferase [Candidatus Omnitrophota bacterium]